MRNKGVAYAAILVAGCATQSPQGRDPTLDVIADSAKEIQALWNVLGGIEKAKDPQYAGRLDDYGTDYPANLRKRLTLKWSGPVEPLLRLLEGEVLYPVTVTGQKPATPVIVVVDANDQRAGDIIRDVGYQAGKRATIRVHVTPGQERIELTYAP